jgi:hypothetical protein
MSLKDLPNMTAQQVYDTVAKHLLTQMKRSNAVAWPRRSHAGIRETYCSGRVWSAAQMTTDELRRMLELAARAMGYVATESFRNGEFRVHDKSDQYWSFAWNPHTDDGDSARMRSALLIDVDWLVELGENDVTSFGVMCWNDKSAHELFADHNNDRNAALRLCALKVAAMIGEGMNG